MSDLCETLWITYVNIVHACFCLFKLLARPLQLPALSCIVNKKQIKPLSSLHTALLFLVYTKIFNRLHYVSEKAYENIASYHYELSTNYLCLKANIRKKICTCKLQFYYMGKLA